MSFKIFGWQGIELEIPEEWELAEETGNYMRGYIRLDDVANPRVRISWMVITKSKAKDPAYEAVKKVKSELKKKDKGVKFIRDTKIKICGHSSRYLHWRGSGDRAELEGCGLFWFCPQTMRGITVVFAFRTDEYWNIRLAIERAVKSIVCHSNGLRKWTAFGTELSIPQDFHLLERKYDLKHLHLLFASKSAHFMFDRLNFANLITSKKYKSLKGWFKKEYRKEVERRFKCSRWIKIEKASFHGHEGILAKALSKKSIIQRRIYVSESHIWLCEETDKIFALTAVREHESAPEVEENLKAILESVMCHK